MNLFREIARTNKAYCTSIGIDANVYGELSDCELNGTPLSPAEIEVAKFQATGINRNAAEMFAALNGPAKGMSGHTKPRPAPAFHAVVEYASHRSMWEQTDIRPFYDDQRAKFTQRAGVWTGD